MFNIFKSKPKNYDLSWLGVDMHSHLIPGIDDGSPDVETSLSLISGLQELGFHTFYATPHIYEEIFPNTPHSITAARDRLNDVLRKDSAFGALSQEGVYAAAEYMLDDDSVRKFEAAAAGGEELMTLPGKQVLVEMSYQFERRDVLEQLFQLQLGGYRPILAHPERYVYYHKDPKTYSRMRERGCKFQLNILSLSGYYGEGVRKVAQNLVKEGMIDYIGTDLHHDKHLQALRQTVQTLDLEKILQPCTLRNAQLFDEQL